MHQLLGNHQSGDAPALTDEQTAENTAGTHSWSYVWNETAYQAETQTVGT